MPGCSGTPVRSGHLIQVLTSDHGLDGRSQPAAPDVHRLLDISPDYGTRLGPAWQFVFARRQAEAHNRECLRSLAQQFQPEVICIWNLQGLPARSRSRRSRCQASAWPIGWQAIRRLNQMSTGCTGPLPPQT